MEGWLTMIRARVRFSPGSARCWRVEDRIWPCRLAFPVLAGTLQGGSSGGAPNLLPTGVREALLLQARPNRRACSGGRSIGSPRTERCPSLRRCRRSK